MTTARKQGGKAAARKGTPVNSAKTQRMAKGEAGTERPARKRSGTNSVPRSMPKKGKDPEGGLTAAGRAYFAAKEGSHLRPGVTGPADTPEKMLRKGSFLRRHFANPRGPMKDEKGDPTRLALSAHAWGEPVPETMSDAHKLAKEGHELLEEYHEAKGDGPERKRAVRKGAASKASHPRKAAAKKTTAKKVAVKKTAAKKSSAKRT